MNRTNEAAFESVIETHLLSNGYLPIAPEGFDRECAIFPETVLAFIRETQPKEWAKLEALHGDKTGEQILGDLCKWMDQNGALAVEALAGHRYVAALEEVRFDDGLEGGFGVTGRAHCSALMRRLSAGG